MAAKKSKQAVLSRALLDAAVSAFEDGEYEQLDQELSQEIGKATDGKSLRQLIFSPALGQASLGDDGFGEPVARALVMSAAGFTKADDKAQTLAIAVRLCSAEPGAVCRPEPQPGDENKALFRQGLAHSLDEVRELLGARSASVRAAAAAVLAVVSNSESDGDSSLALLEDKDRSLAATGVLGAANIAARIKSSKLQADVKQAASSVATTEPLILRVSAAAALHLIGEALPATLSDALVDGLTSSDTLPPAWGWYANEVAGKPAALSELAARYARVIPPERRVEVIDKLASKRATDEQAALLLSLAFPPGTISRIGVLPDTLDEPQRKVLAVFADPPLAMMRNLLVPLGFQAGGHLKLLLDEVAPSWAPISVEYQGESRRLPPVMVLRAVLYDEMDPAVALKALTTGMSADTLIAFLTDSMRTGFTSSPARAADPEGNNRVQELLLLLWQWLEKDGKMPPEALEARAAEGKDRMSEGMLLLWHATEGRGPAFTPELAAKIVKARKLARGKQPFDRLASQLDEEQQAAVHV
ncbi:MAG: hypothetical protein KC766_24850 [Myxococcales bacterium]|nr:hypothetical protein [Myxococcales bacterium]